MKGTRQLGEELFTQRFRQIERIVHTVAARRRLSADESQELYSLVMLKLIEDNYAILRGFQGRSRWQTFLTVIIQRVLLDHRVKEWGRWRPCAQARRLGPTAVLLDRRINRDGVEPAAAIRELSSIGVAESAVELERLAARIPRRSRRRFVSEEMCLEILPSTDAADHRLEAAHCRRAVGRVSHAVTSALRELSDAERRLLSLRFGRGWTVRRIAASQALEARPLYRHFERILRCLRQHLERFGVGWDEVIVALDAQDVDLEVDMP